jgi:prolyl 4-hydroxylase
MTRPDQETDNYNDWITLVQGLEKGLDTMLFCLVEILGLGVSRTNVRKIAIPRNTDQGFAIETLIDVIDSWGQKIKRHSALHENSVRGPMVVSVCFEGRTRHLLVTHMDSQYAELVASTGTRRLVPRQVLEHFFAGTIVRFDESRFYVEEGYATKRAAECERAALYDASIEEIGGFLSIQECRELLHLADARYQRSSVVLHAESDGRSYSDSRTSHSVVFTEEHSLLASIRSRAAAICRLPVEHVEPVQCVRYREGEEYGLHEDAFETTTSNRAYTILVYLNDDFEGGKTWFSETDRLVEPETGKALFFANLTSDQRVQPLSRHASLPVMRGEKYVCNIWVRNHPHDHG